MTKKELIPFYVIREEYGKFIPYDIMDYLIRAYKDKKKEKRPITFDEFKEFIKKSRCINGGHVVNMRLYL